MHEKNHWILFGGIEARWHDDPALHIDAIKGLESEGLGCRHVDAVEQGEIRLRELADVGQLPVGVADTHYFGRIILTFAEKHQPFAVRVKAEIMPIGSKLDGLYGVPVLILQGEHAFQHTQYVAAADRDLKKRFIGTVLCGEEQSLAVFRPDDLVYRAIDTVCQQHGFTARAVVDLQVVLVRFVSGACHAAVGDEFSVGRIHRLIVIALVCRSDAAGIAAVDPYKPDVVVSAGGNLCIGVFYKCDFPAVR